MDITDIKKSLTLRIFSLVLLIVLVNSWLIANIGRDLKKVAAVNIILLFIAITGSVVKYLSESVQKDVMMFFRSVLLFVLNSSIIISLWAVFILVCLFTSSVTLQTRTNASVCNASLYRMSSSSQLRERSSQRISNYLKPQPVLVNPFGRTFRLDIEGYQSFTFEVFPLVPKRIVVENDMIRAPSVYIRMSDEIQSHQTAYRIRVSYRGKILFENIIGVTGAFFFGINQKVPNEFLERWQLELKSREDIVDDKEYYKLLKYWIIDYKFIAAELNPRDTLDIKIIRADSSVFKDIDYPIGFEIIQDLLLK